MTDRNLSPAAQAVMTAGTMGNLNVINDPVYRQCIAAAIRAATQYLAYEAYGEGWFELVVDARDLYDLAKELEGGND